jgi:hypothetical protein
MSALSYGWELQFRLRFAETRGDEFQNFFCGIMERRDADFQRVRPWGNEGDRKNDGFSPGTRRLFQSYAPSTFTMSDLLSKMQDDYDGAISYWADFFDTWIFVHNDIHGLGPSAATKALELDAAHESVCCETWGRERIRQEFAQLTDSDRTALLGPPLTIHDFVDVNVEAIQPVLDHLAISNPVPGEEPRGGVPIDKVERNLLSDEHGQLLRLGETKMHVVGDYLTRASIRPQYADDVAALFRDKYIEYRDAGRSSDDVLDGLVAWLMAGSTEASRLVPVMTVVAYFFSTCQIFEEGGFPSS